jgi:hypothetical protein
VTRLLREEKFVKGRQSLVHESCEMPSKPRHAPASHLVEPPRSSYTAKSIKHTSLPSTHAQPDGPIGSDSPTPVRLNHAGIQLPLFALFRAASSSSSRTVFSRTSFKGRS